MEVAGNFQKNKKWKLEEHKLLTKTEQLRSQGQFCHCEAFYFAYHDINLNIKVYCG